MIFGVRPEHCRSLDGEGSPAHFVVVEPTGADTQIFAKHGRAQINAVFRERHDSAPGNRSACCPTTHGPICSMPAAGENLTARPPLDRSQLIPSNKRRRTAMSEFNRRDFLKATAGVAAAARARHGIARCCRRRRRAGQSARRRRAPSCACCAGSASCRATKTCGRRTPRSSPPRPASKCASTRKAGKTCGRRPPSRPTSAAAPTSSSAR